MKTHKFWKQNLYSNYNEIQKIKDLRKVIDYLLSANNTLVKQLWTINQKLLVKKLPCVTRNKLLEQQKQLNDKINDENFSEKIKELRYQVYSLEKKELGDSNILSSSPSHSRQKLS